ncbi:MAG TPA: AI-2E family transporter [Xanthobacteraceae bacterium]|nr:AI-2E family transporter [Xanthobacteraceae bacterium]
MHLERNVVFWVAALVVFVGLLWLLSPILLPFVLGMAIAYVLDPLANRLSKHGVSRLLAALIILGGFVAVLVLLLLLIAPVLSQQFSSFIENAPFYAQRLQVFVSDPSHPWIKRMIGDNLVGADKSVGDILNQAMGYLTRFLASLWSQGQTLLSIFSLVIITPVVAFYLICDWDRMLSTMDRLVPLPQRETVRSLGREIDATISAYVRGQSGICLILGSYYAVGLTLAGLNFGLLIGVVSGLISFIPYVGSLTALVLALAVAAAQFIPDWTRIVTVVGIVLVGQFLEGNLLSPKLVGHSVGLHPVWLMFALFAFGYLFGFVGLLLAVPLAAAAGVLIRFAIRRYLASPFYTGARPP